MAVDLATARALRAGTRLLAEQCETGDPTTQDAVEQAVEILAQRIALDAEADPSPRPLPRLDLPLRPGPPQRPTRGAEAACHAAAMRLRAVVRDLPPASPGACGVARLARALEEHAIGLEGLLRSWPAEGAGPRVRRAERAATRLQAILLAECRAVQQQAAG